MEEAYQKALIVLWELSESKLGCEPDNVYTWVTTVLRRREIDKYRAEKRKGIHVSIDDDSMALGVRSDDDTEELKRIESLFGCHSKSLDLDLKLLFEKHIAGYKYKEIAKMHNLPIGTIRSKLSRACKKVKKSLEVNNG